jgi:hypothetical protein
MYTKDATVLFCLVWLWDPMPTQTQNEPQIETKLGLFANEHLRWHGWSSYIQKQKTSLSPKEKKKKVLFDHHFDCQGTLFPSKILKDISKISTLNF